MAVHSGRGHRTPSGQVPKIHLPQLNRLSVAEHLPKERICHKIGLFRDRSLNGAGRRAFSRNFLHTAQTSENCHWEVYTPNRLWLLPVALSPVHFPGRLSARTPRRLPHIISVKIFLWKCTPIPATQGDLRHIALTLPQPF